MGLFMSVVSGWRSESLWVRYRRHIGENRKKFSQRGRGVWRRAKTVGPEPGFAGKWAMPQAMPLLDEFHYHHRLRQTPGKSLVLFGSATCGACRLAERRLPDVAPPDVRLYRVDVLVSQALARALEVFHLPSMFLYVDGHYHARLDCPLTREALAGAIDLALALPPQEEP